MKQISKTKAASEFFVLSSVSATETRLEEKIEDSDSKAEDRYSKLMEKLVDIAGKFQKFDEAQVILSAKVSEHSDRIEKLEESSLVASN